MSFPRFEAYRESGLEWLNEVPAHWQVTRVKHIAPFTTGWTPPTSDAEAFEGDNLWANISDLGPKSLSDTAKRVSDRAVAAAGAVASPAGSLLFSFKLSVGQVSFAATEMFTNEAIATFRASQNLDLSFAYYAFPLFLIENAATNIYGAKLLNQQLIRSARLPLPPIPEQRAIGAFLDSETEKIDSLIAEQSRLSELLDEKRRAVISRAIGEFHCRPTSPLWHVADLLPGFAFSSEEFTQGDEGTRLLRGINVGVGACRWDDEVRWSGEMNDRIARYMLVPGDVVMGMDRPWISEGARVAPVTELDTPALLVQRVLRVRPRGDCSADYIRLVLSSREFREHIEASLTGVSVPHISEAQVGRFPIPTVSAAEQRVIAGEVQADLAELEGLVSEAKGMIALLYERRAALISAAVTGQIDVRALVQSDAPHAAEAAAA